MHQARKPCQEEQSAPKIKILQKSPFNANEKKQLKIIPMTL